MDKPVFLTKAQREAQKQQKEEEKKKQEQLQQTQNQAMLQQFLRKGSARQSRLGREELREIQSKRSDRNNRHKQRRNKRTVSPERKRSRSKEKTQRNGNDKPMTEEEIDYMKKKYFGMIKEKKKLQKPSEKFHTNFVFDWDESEDTSKDVSELYSSRKDPHLLFGKGHIGGIDPKQSKGGETRIEREKSDLHWSRKALAEMTSRDWRIFREDNDISLKGPKAPLPFRSWEESGLPDYIIKAISRIGYRKPTEVQMQGIPIGLEERDLIAIAPTGSGKSCAYLVPLICCLASMPPLNMKNFDDGPRALIMTPTRELAIQVEEDFKKFAHYTKLTSALVIGGVIYFNNE
eukprot:TRINITY_DN7789_c0_g5_i1.p1 TRINITY_DN7789_c0_g5~~TRINITY_DN7789_c0_g5_i1.p1  ORF type:complete len:347 (-),score=103.69 TRINITY_DN7789_c0_g5_i1:1126-2166(-)